MKLPNLKGKTANIKPQKHFLLEFLSVPRGGGISLSACRRTYAQAQQRLLVLHFAPPTVLSALLLEPPREALFLVAQTRRWNDNARLGQRGKCLSSLLGRARGFHFHSEYSIY